MPNSLQSYAITPPASQRATNCRRSSITEHSFHGITPSQKKGESVTYVSGTIGHLCVGSLIVYAAFYEPPGIFLCCVRVANSCCYNTAQNGPLTSQFPVVGHFCMSFEGDGRRKPGI